MGLRIYFGPCLAHTAIFTVAGIMKVLKAGKVYLENRVIVTKIERLLYLRHSFPNHDEEPYLILVSTNISDFGGS